MTTGFSPFLIADVDETFGFAPEWSPSTGSSVSQENSPRLELIRRRVLTGYYASPTIATELARRLVDKEALDSVSED